jgi:hypothetical protein
LYAKHGHSESLSNQKVYNFGKDSKDESMGLTIQPARDYYIILMFRNGFSMPYVRDEIDKSIVKSFKYQFVKNKAGIFKLAFNITFAELFKYEPELAELNKPYEY